jgi:hypothetical protein
VVINEGSLAPAPAIIDDRKESSFWSAILGGEESAIDMAPAEQEQVRQFVIDDDWTSPIMRSEVQTLRDKIAAVGALRSARQMASRTPRFRCGGGRDRWMHHSRCGVNAP